MKIGFIGCGNMAKAMMKGMLKSELAAPSDIIASDTFEEVLKKTKESTGINISKDNKEVAEFSEIIFLAVKPRYYEEVIDEIKPLISEQIIISITPNFSIEQLEGLLGKEIKIVRIMPNTPAMVGAGMTAMCYNSKVSNSDANSVKKILEGFGIVEIVPEYMMDAVVAVSGSSPAYVFMFIEAMADAAVLKGMSRQQAYTFAAQAVLGSAKMVLESGKHPAELKDMVCSPSGTTIEAVRVLENLGFRASVIEAMIACAEKSAGN